MVNTNELIAILADTTGPVKPAANPLRLFIKWLAGSALYVGGLLFFLHFRLDLATKLHAPLFVAEIISLMSLLITSGLSAAALSFPDLYQKRWLVYLPVLPLVLFVGVLTMAWIADNPPASRPVHGIECLLCITVLSWFPAGWMFYQLRQQASTHYYGAGTLALVAASSMGCLALRLSENTDSISHLIEWHYLPMIGFGAIGLLLGKIFLKW